MPAGVGTSARSQLPRRFATRPRTQFARYVSLARRRRVALRCARRRPKLAPRFGCPPVPARRAALGRSAHRSLPPRGGSRALRGGRRRRLAKQRFPHRAPPPAWRCPPTAALHCTRFSGALRAARSCRAVGPQSSARALRLGLRRRLTRPAAHRTAPNARSSDTPLTAAELAELTLASDAVRLRRHAARPARPRHTLRALTRRQWAGVHAGYARGFNGCLVRRRGARRAPDEHLSRPRGAVAAERAGVRCARWLRSAARAEPTLTRLFADASHLGTFGLSPPPDDSTLGPAPDMPGARSQPGASLARR